MQTFVPSNFVELLAGLSFSVALILGLLSLFPALRSHTIKLLALLLVAALTLFSNHWSTYFAGIFVIATAVTELEFLQNLAAIIRGNKEYFDYKKEMLTHEEKEQKIKEEQDQLEEQEEASQESAVDTAVVKTFKAKITPQSPDTQMLLDLENKALDKMEQYYGKKIERGVSVSRKDMRVTFDGLIPSIVDDVYSETLFDVKYLRSPDQLKLVERLFPKFESQAKSYCQITNKIAKLHIVLVIGGDKTLSEEQFERLKRLVHSSSIATGYSVFTTEDLEQA